MEQNPEMQKQMEIESSKNVIRVEKQNQLAYTDILAAIDAETV